MTLAAVVLSLNTQLSVCVIAARAFTYRPVLNLIFSVMYFILLRQRQHHGGTICDPQPQPSSVPMTVGATEVYNDVLDVSLAYMSV